MKTIQKAILFILGAYMALSVMSAHGQTNHRQDANNSFKVAAVTGAAGIVLITGAQLTEQGQRIQFVRKGVKMGEFTGNKAAQRDRLTTLGGAGGALLFCALVSTYIGIDEYRMSVGVTNNGLTVSYKIR